MPSFFWAMATLPVFAALDLWIAWSARMHREVFFFTPRVLFENPSVAFSMPFPAALILPFGVGAALLLLIAAVRAYRRRAFSSTWALSAILAGGIANMIDRIFWNSITDYLVLPGGLFFNIADVLIVAGLVAWIFTELRYRARTLV
ncbi:MAG: signal peptidase II [bacterium]|nr:signal peptidase II [bacterium]